VVSRVQRAKPGAHVRNEVCVQLFPLRNRQNEPLDCRNSTSPGKYSAVVSTSPIFGVTKYHRTSGSQTLTVSSTRFTLFSGTI
jgi:hypothetical protein